MHIGLLLFLFRINTCTEAKCEKSVRRFKLEDVNVRVEERNVRNGAIRCTCSIGERVRGTTGAINLEQPVSQRGDGASSVWCEHCDQVRFRFACGARAAAVCVPLVAVEQAIGAGGVVATGHARYRVDQRSLW